MNRYAKLQRAVIEPNLEKVVRLASKGANLHEVDSDGRTLLHWAASRGNPAIVEFLLQQNVSHSARSDYDFTALHLANCGETAKLLLNAGADIDARNGETNEKIWKSIGNAPIHAATWYESLDVIDVLVERGADINCQNNDGTAPIHEAAGFHTVEFLTSIIRRGADIDKCDGRDHTPLHYAFENNNNANVCALVEAGATIPQNLQSEIDSLDLNR
jgi:ankyrin repeat protein